ncbi:hypothetical protein IE077_000737 [Cardiosporidium cionae]|uniref:Cation efflux protein transmembrane domain-containing protein n=1 Tax=Cardiosporidium cionae TaxID=476202 RepID=A0ABQ7J400_9APIC|nr:hypothetical protein IE077_000737 [Cardiosporidium cionae]|eukprot:KAF8817815.1 hypothetical protein IE077_000737 [Cardiosporidium cionae]
MANSSDDAGGPEKKPWRAYTLPPLPALKASQFMGGANVVNSIRSNATFANVISTVSNSTTVARLKELKEDALRNFSLVRQARAVSYISLFFTVVYGSCAIGVGFITGAVSLLAIGLEMYIDCLTSAAVLWRYWKEEAFSVEKEETLEGLEYNLRLKGELESHRERLANFSVGVLFVALAVFVLIEGVYHIASGNTAIPTQARITDATLVAVISWLCVVCFSGLVWWKFVLSARLNSALIKKDAMCSAFGVLLSILSGIAAIIELSNTTSSAASVAATATLVDGIFAIIISGFILFEGLRSLYHNSGAIRSYAPIKF